MEVWYIFWILAGVGDPLPDLEHRCHSLALMQESSTSDVTMNKNSSGTYSSEQIRKTITNKYNE